MRYKLTILLSFALCFLLVASAFSQTEDEIVSRYFKKTEKKHGPKVGFVEFQGSYGRLLTQSDYNEFTLYASPQITSSTGGTGLFEGIYRSKEFYLGFGMMATPKVSFTFGINYWLKLGSNFSGDYNLSLVNYNDPTTHSGFELESRVQVWGITGQFSYYFLDHPDKEGLLSNLALKVGGGGGFYFATWKMWDNYASYNTGTGTYEQLDGNLTGKAPGFTLAVSAEYPIKLGGLVVEAGAKYFYLNFNNMKWYNSSNEENVVVYNNNNDRVDLDLSGPRAQFGIKRYFSW